MYEVDQMGLDRLDRAVLVALVERFNGGPVGLSTLAIAVGEETETVEAVAEPFLVRNGLMARTAMPGAVIMNAEAALRSGAGLVTVAVPSAIHAKAALMLPEAMWIPLKLGQTSLPAEVKAVAHRADTVLFGSGLGTNGITLASSTARSISGIAVLDADALNPKVIHDARGAAQRILLPHAGEFLRMTGKRATPEAAHLAAKKLRAIIVLKGPLTVVADGDSLTYIPFGGPVLARGGSGDLLAGIVASVVARRRILKMTPLQATIAAVTWHALAADWLTQHKGETAVRTTQLLDGLSPTLRRR
jgi:NAD(P)H-hydrate epimerase